MPTLEDGQQEEQQDRKISIASLTDEAAPVELTQPQGSLSAGVLNMVRQYLKPELDSIKARLKALEAARE